ncbi:hypothetical protein ABQW67_11150 [Xanthomonas hortorum]|uniref:Transposase n=1 Tax=Xanthomonas hortorum pv. vitians TaxID=83224 RepID=A0AAW8ZQN2_9XANT|nr:hypothetical protein [Xanthomonas hortorum]MCE4505382.1 hypothetical protein [Xanthomonas hortorum pv. vitians]MCE4549819.1 hypothetical protein [Xanthomonas hortorum pv. vitians]MDT7820586.1 hypothetical protein [Xanthomonas hortorum pv. vitians]MDV7248256.1 hypothetical protein [Xanthomonas hortorum pv. vitians]
MKLDGLETTKSMDGQPHNVHRSVCSELIRRPGRGAGYVIAADSVLTPVKAGQGQAGDNVWISSMLKSAFLLIHRLQTGKQG